MRILHISDNHSALPDWSKSIDYNSIDAICHSGDFMPSFSRGKVEIEVPRQEEWTERNKERICEWFHNKPVLFIMGNHDYYNPVNMLRNAGLDIRNLTLWDDETGLRLPLDFGGYSWYGFPWIPVFTGEWNFETQSQVLQELVVDVLDSKPDIIVSHGPMRGVLDRNSYGESCGSYEWKINMEDQCRYGYKLPKAFLHGHIHESLGRTEWNGMIVSNAATMYNIIEID